MADPFRCPACGSKRLRWHQVRTFSIDMAVVPGRYGEPEPGRVLRSNQRYHDHAEGDDYVRCLDCDHQVAEPSMPSELSYEPRTTEGGV